MPNYIRDSTFLNQQHFRDMLKLRTGAHWLFVEVGRWGTGANRLDRLDRVCPLCPCNAVEDEQHMLLECPFYDSSRLQFGIVQVHTMADVFSLQPTKVAAYISACRVARGLAMQAREHRQQGGGETSVLPQPRRQQRRSSRPTHSDTSSGVGSGSVDAWTSSSDDDEDSEVASMITI